MPQPKNISGSRSSAILGQSEYQTPVQVWLQIMGEDFCNQRGYTYPVIEDNAAMKFGRLAEDAIISFTEKKLKKKITRRQELIEKDYLTCHPDGVINDTLIEVKTTGIFTYKDQFGDEESGEIPVSYQLQVHHNMYLLNLKKCIMPLLILPRRPEEIEAEGIDIEKLDYTKWVYVLNQMGYLKYYKIERNDELIDLMLKKYSDFWNNHVLTGIEPDVQNYEDIKLLCPTASGVIISTEEIERLSAEYKNINDEIGHSGQLFKRKENIRLEILKYMREQDKRMEKILDEDAINKFVLRDRTGRKLFQYDGKVFR